MRRRADRRLVAGMLEDGGDSRWLAAGQKKRAAPHGVPGFPEEGEISASGAAVVEIAVLCIAQSVAQSGTITCLALAVIILFLAVSIGMK